jgi:uncharacterized membrane protein
LFFEDKSDSFALADLVVSADVGAGAGVGVGVGVGVAVAVAVGVAVDVAGGRTFG